MERKLASIQQITKLEPIEGADKIEVATVLGWHVVVQKGLYQEGDLVVYCEVDSLLPMVPKFEFLAKSGTKKTLIDGKEVEGYRIKTIRLRGQISQGICFPAGGEECVLPSQTDVFEGKDVTGILGIVKFEPAIPAVLSGEALGVFPGYIPKTDEMRIQSVPEVLERWRGETLYMTEKLDGTSMTVYKNNTEFGVCSRNLNLKETPTNSLWKVARDLRLEQKMKDLRYDYAIQGELIGEGIQRNIYKIKGQTFRVFSIYNITQLRYLGLDAMRDLIDELGLDMVPVLDASFKLPVTPSVDELVNHATRKSELNPDEWAEGIVIRSVIEQHDVDLGRLSFKVINPEFLLKNE